MRSRREQRLAIAGIGAWWLANVAAPVKALQYSRRAQRDERNGFLHTAAMEWRKAAEVVFPNTFAAEYCWRQWERIMRLPRRFAGPLNLGSIVALPQTPASSTFSTEGPLMDQIPLPSAA